MVAAFHLDNLLVLLFFALAILFQLLTRAATKSGRRRADTRGKSTSPPQTSRPIVGESDETDEERIRKFLEALGQPPTAKPPPPVVHRTDIPPRPVAPIEPPVSMRPFSFPQRRLTPAERPKKSVILHEAAQTPAPAFEVGEGRAALEPPLAVAKAAEEAYAIETQSTAVPQRTEMNIVALLRSTSGLRDAIILREIFGPPRSLQPLDLVGSV
jgi:hypothetical protein